MTHASAFARLALVGAGHPALIVRRAGLLRWSGRLVSFGPWLPPMMIARSLLSIVFMSHSVCSSDAKRLARAAASERPPDHTSAGRRVKAGMSRAPGDGMHAKHQESITTARLDAVTGGVKLTPSELQTLKNLWNIASPRAKDFLKKVSRMTAGEIDRL